MPNPRISQQSMGLGVISSLEGVDGEACWVGSGSLLGFGVPALLDFPMCSLTRKPSPSHVPDSWIFRNTGTIAQIMWYEHLQPLLSWRSEAEASSPLTPAGVLKTSPHRKVPIPLLQEPSHLHSRYPITGEMPRSCEALDSRLASWLYWILQLRSAWL